VQSAGLPLSNSQYSLSLFRRARSHVVPALEVEVVCKRVGRDEEETARCDAAVKGETVRCAPAVEEEISSRSAGILRPHPDDACAAEGDLLPPRARPRARGLVFAPSPTMLGPFASQRVAAADRGDVAKGFEASCCLPLTMAVRACTCTCDCTATVTLTVVGEHEMGSKDSAAKAGGRLEPPCTLAQCCDGSTAAVGSRVCDFACSTDAGVELPTSRILVRRPNPKVIEQIRCACCLQDRSSGQFPQGATTAEDNDKICLPCRSQWMPSGVVYNGHQLPIIPGSSPTRFLGIHGDMRGECSMQISLVFQKSASIVNFLREKKLSTRHNLSLVSMTLPSYVRFPSGVISWTGSSLLKLDRLWTQAYKMACGVSRSTASCIMRFPSALGGRNLPTPIAVICETVWSHLESCCFDVGGLRELLL
jgi:hypothetical protein